MGETKLTNPQLVLLNDVKEDIQLYKEELSAQIKGAKLNMYIGTGIAVVIGTLLVFKPEVLESIMGKLSSLSANMEVIGSVVGEGLPILFGLKSLNNSKDQKRRLKGLRVFEKTIARMEEGIIPNSQEHILALETEFSRYINS